MNQPTTGQLMDALLGFQEAVMNKFDHQDRRFDALERKLVKHDARFDEVNRRLDEHHRKFHQINRKIDAMDVWLQRIDAK